MQPVARGRGLVWDWNEAARGATCAAPGALLVASGHVGLGLFCAIGVLPVAMLGTPHTRHAVTRFVTVGLLFAVAYALGSVIGTIHVFAVVALTAAAYAATLAITRSPIARLVAGLLVPAFALGMNEPPASGIALAGLFIAGSLWAVLVAVGLRHRVSPPAQAMPAPPTDGRAVHVYAAFFAAAAGLGLALGYLLDVAHQAWIAAAAMFIMRPSPDLDRQRALQRLIATVTGVLLAGLITMRDPNDLVLAAIAIAAIAAIVATRTSRWYVAPFGSALIILLLSGINGTADSE